MVSRLKTAALVIVVAVAALVPLFGDPRLTPVTHPIWARMLLRALEMNEAVRASTRASEAFAALSWRDSLTFPADRYVRGDGVTVRERDGVRAVAASEGTGQIVYPLTVVRGGDYQMRVRLAGAPERPATAEIGRMGGAAALKTLTFVPPASAEWVRGAPTHLDPGSYTATVLLPQGSSLEYVEVAPPCLNPIEPVGGWKPTAPTTVEDVAVTVLKAVDVESELPPADTALERTGGDFQLEASAAPVAAPGPGFETRTLKADRKGLRAVLTVELPEAGLYTLSAFGVTGGGQRWLADDCRKAILCPSEGPGWRVVMSQSFGAGRHTFAVALADGAVVERLRLERKKERGADYAATLRRLGFDAGPDGPVSWDRAVAAMRFIQDQRRAVSARLCGDVALPEPGGPSPPVAEAAAPAAAPAPAPVAANPPSAPIGSVLLPPQLPASPVTPLSAEVAGPSS
jgi:hypothetical protein